MAEKMAESCLTQLVLVSFGDDSGLLGDYSAILRRLFGDYSMDQLTSLSWSLYRCGPAYVVIGRPRLIGTAVKRPRPACKLFRNVG